MPTLDKAQRSIRRAGPVGNGPASGVILLRTHKIDPLIELYLQRLRNETGWHVCLALDSLRDGHNRSVAAEHVQITQQVLAELEVFTTPDSLWRCGDYALYAAQMLYPNAPFFWMLEPDVRLNLQNLGDFFHLFSRHPEYDLLAALFAPAGDEWPWSAMMRPFAENSYRCFYPVVRVSARALDYMLEKRRALSRRFVAERRTAQGWPNDEVFTATELQRGHFRCADLNCTGIQFYSPDTFNFDKPFAASRFDLIPPDGKIYHPVLASSDYLQKVRRMLEDVRNMGGPPELIRGLFERKSLLQDITAECGVEESDRFAADVASLLVAAG
jgi:hypothetical protein